MVSSSCIKESQMPSNDKLGQTPDVGQSKHFLHWLLQRRRLDKAPGSPPGSSSSEGPGSILVLPSGIASHPL